ncbi:hypothetical protein [Streptomyces sp. NPDC048473]|uniref:hypothetical protein n=1 Tax=unclassified Streptomyces TaxID=2593676 RepID=UPI003720E7CE
MSGAILGYQPLEKPSEWPLVADGVRMVAAATCDSVPYPVPKVMLALSGLAMYAERGIARQGHCMIEICLGSSRETEGS